MMTRHRIWMVGVALLVCASTAAALSLGRARGAVLIGRGLDISVQTTLGAQEPLPEANCLAVDVFYGDVRVSPNAVSISADRSAAGEASVRIRTNAAIDEPVVTVYLRSSCGASVSRRYVLLADTLTEIEAVLPAVIAPAQVPRVTAPPTEPAPSPPRTSGASATSAGGGATASSSAATERAAQRQARRQERARLAQERAEQGAAQNTEPRAVAGSDASASRSIMRQTSPRKTSGPRLQVDLLDLASYEPSLRSSNELTTEPSQDAAVRSQAQALWRSLNASPEEAMRDAKRLETLEAQMRASLEQSKRQGQDIASLSTQLQAANQARYFNPFTIFLGLLTLLALGLTAWLWRRGSTSGQPWYRGQAERAPQDESHLWEQFKEEPPVSASSILSGAQPAAPTRSGPSVPASRAANPALDKSSLRFAERPTNSLEFAPSSAPISQSSAKIQPLGSAVPASRGGSMGRVDSTPPPSLMQQPKPSARAGANASSSASRSGFGNTDFGQSGFANSRLIAAEELFDIQEQADFFMSLGQPDQAIEVLKNHITDNVETSALAYMDLFDIYHRANRQKDYQELRDEFNRVFNAQAPNFERYGQQNNGLETYPEAIENIQRHWPGPHTLDVIEESIFRQPDSETPPFDMLAYRELMLLYALAKELNKPGASFMPVQAMAPIVGLSSNGMAQDDQLTDSGLIGLPDATNENEGLGLDLSYAGSDELNEAIARDTTFRIPKLPEVDDNSLDFDLSEVAELPKGKPTI